MCVLLEGVLEVAVNRNERGFFPLNSLKGKLRPRKTVRGDGKGERGWGLKAEPLTVPLHGTAAGWVRAQSPELRSC